jgi:hypothetical protein
LPALLVWRARSAGARSRHRAMRSFVRWGALFADQTTQTARGLVLRPPTRGSRFALLAGPSRGSKTILLVVFSSTEIEVPVPRLHATPKVGSWLAPAGRRRHRPRWGPAYRLPVNGRQLPARATRAQSRGLPVLVAVVVSRPHSGSESGWQCRPRRRVCSVPAPARACTPLVISVATGNSFM